MFMIHKECKIKENTRYHRIKTDCSHSLAAYYTEELSAKRRYGMATATPLWAWL